MKSEASGTSSTAKLIACLLVLIFLAVGAVGLILPIIPGLLFLAIAAVVAAKHSSSIDRLLRRSPALAGYLDSADGFVDLTFWRKVQFGCLLCLKMSIDGIAFVVSVVTKLKPIFRSSAP
jgi:uncharacterized membrane protein YbaN (DUF454 family)